VDATAAAPAVTPGAVQTTVCAIAPQTTAAGSQIIVSYARPPKGTVPFSPIRKLGQSPGTPDLTATRHALAAVMARWESSSNSARKAVVLPVSSGGEATPSAPSTSATPTAAFDSPGGAATAHALLFGGYTAGRSQWMAEEALLFDGLASFGR
jgi:hypothetical protein